MQKDGVQRRAELVGHVRQQVALSAQIVDQSRVLQGRTRQGRERAQQAEVSFRQQRSHPARVHVQEAELPPGGADGRAEHRAQPEIEDARARAEILAPDDVRDRDHLAGAQHAVGDGPRDAQGRARAGATHCRHARLGARVAEEDEAALGTGEQQRLVESVLEQSVRIALPRQPLGRLGERLDVRKRPALERLHVFLDLLDLAQVGGRAQPLEDHAGAAKGAGRLHQVPAIQLQQAGDAVDAGQLQCCSRALQRLPCRSLRGGGGGPVAARARGEGEDAPEIASLDQAAGIAGELERLRCAHGGRFRVAQKQVELGEPPLGFEDLVARPDPVGDFQRLPVELAGRRGIPFPRRDFAEVAAHHRLDARVPTRAPDLGQRAGEQLPGPGRVAPLAVEETQVVQVVELLLERLAALPGQLLPGLQGAVPIAGEVARDAQIVPGERLLAFVAEDPVDLQSAGGLPGRAVVAGLDAVRGAQPREGVGRWGRPGSPQ